MDQLVKEYGALLPKPIGIAVAVSGGADSMALAMLCNLWIKEQQPNINLVCVTVDHGLRPESGNEAVKVHHWFKSHNINHTTLKWVHGPIVSKLQAQARSARYELLEKYCTNNSVSILLTAHHANDQWETFFMRLNKGSGPVGLECIRPVSKTSFGFLARPLLMTDPDDLKKYLNDLDQPYIDDPSNENDIFERIKWRNFKKTLPQDMLNVTKIQKTIGHLTEQNEFVSRQIEKHFENCVTLTHKDNHLIYGTLNFDKWFCFDPFMQKEVLKRILNTITDYDYGPSNDSIESLLNSLITGKGPTTLRGYEFFKIHRNSLIAFVMQPRTLPRVLLNPQLSPQIIKWGWENVIVNFSPDQLSIAWGGFQQSISLPGGDNLKSVHLKPLADDFQYKALPPALLSKNTPKRIALSQPGLWINDELVWSTHGINPDKT